jgi:hypothetical protein
MASNDLERAVELGARLTLGVVGLGVQLALAPARLVLRALAPTAREPRWEPIDGPGPVPAEPAVSRPEPAAANGGPPPEPTPLRSDDLTAADAARRREAEREAGTEPDSPGPEIHVEEPWPGYDAMNVADVLGRLRQANPTLLVMVRLYEETHKNRLGVLHATGGE